MLLLLPFSLVLSAFLLVILVGLKDSYNTRYQPHGFDPYATYSNGTHDFYPLTLVLSLDGFHPSLVSSEATPFLHQLFSLQHPNTSVAPFMLPCFPSQTFPNHWAMVSGLKPGNNGIVANWFWDRFLQKQFGPGNVDPTIWQYTAEPIWITLQRQFFGGSFRTAAHMWPGCEVQGQTPHSYTAFNESETLQEKADAVFRNYIDIGTRDERPQLLLVYAPQPDAYGHQHGYPVPHTPSFRSLLRGIDAYVSRVFAGLRERHMLHFTNVVILSDHGMASVPAHHVLLENELISHELRIHHISHSYLEGPALALYTPNASHVQHEVSRTLASIPIGQHFHITTALPANFHYPLGSNRTADVWVLPDVHYAVAHDRRLLGTHGYNNSSPEMRALFLAHGPAFSGSAGYVQPFDNTAVHSLLLELAGVQPAAEPLLLPLRAFSDDFSLLTRTFGNGSTYNSVFHNETVPLDSLAPEKQIPNLTDLLGEIIGELQTEISEWGS